MFKKYHLGRLLALLLILTGVFTITGTYAFTRYLRPKIIRISQRFAENEVSNLIDTEVKRLMHEEFLNYDEIAVINRDSSGRVTSVTANSVLINKFANDIDIAIGDRIDDSDLMENKIYLSSLLGFDILSGMGPKIPVRFQPVSVTNADITHTFEEAGINQTIHTIHLNITVEIEILMPFAYSRIDVVSNMPLSQTLIVGVVPDAYINRQK